MTTQVWNGAAYVDWPPEEAQGDLPPIPPVLNRALTIHQDDLPTNAVYQGTDVSGGSMTGGTWAITINGETTAVLAWDATTQEITDALGALPSIGEGNAYVYGGITAYPFVIEFIGDLGEQPVVAEITFDLSDLTGPDEPYSIEMNLSTTGSVGGPRTLVWSQPWD